MPKCDFCGYESDNENAFYGLVSNFNDYPECWELEGTICKGCIGFLIFAIRR